MVSLPVLILVVVENGLVLTYLVTRVKLISVLILVVVEDGLVRKDRKRRNKDYPILILVVVEDGLVLHVGLILQLVSESRNPCCSGRWSRTPKYDIKGFMVKS